MTEYRNEDGSPSAGSGAGPDGAHAEWETCLNRIKQRIERAQDVLSRAKDCIPTSDESHRAAHPAVDAHQADLFITFVSLECSLDECERWARKVVQQTRAVAQVKRPCELTTEGLKRTMHD